MATNKATPKSMHLNVMVEALGVRGRAAAGVSHAMMRTTADGCPRHVVRPPTDPNYLSNSAVLLQICRSLNLDS